MFGLICWTKSTGREALNEVVQGIVPRLGARGEKMVAIFTLFCIVFIDSGNKHKILNKISWKLPVWASCVFPSHPPATCQVASPDDHTASLLASLCCVLKKFGTQERS